MKVETDRKHERRRSSSVANLHKWYSGVHALKDVSLTIDPGEALGLVGDNGAGKSTLIKILSGVHQPDAGRDPASTASRSRIRTPKRRDGARDRDDLPVQRHGPDDVDRPQRLHRARAAEVLGLFGFGMLDQKRMREESVQAIADVDLHLRSPDALVGELSGGQRQGVAIARAMHFKSKVMILDEPTNHLSVKETNKVLGFVRGLQRAERHRHLHQPQHAHVFHCCDRIVAMARGEIVFDKPVGETSIDEVQELLCRWRCLPARRVCC